MTTKKAKKAKTTKLVPKLELTYEYPDGHKEVKICDLPKAK